MLTYCYIPGMPVRSGESLGCEDKACIIVKACRANKDVEVIKQKLSKVHAELLVLHTKAGKP